MKILIWTEGYSPWIMGGDVHAPIGIEVDVIESTPIGKGFKAFVVKSPNKKVTVIAEARSGAIVGNALAQVCNDVMAGKKAVMTKQVRNALERVKRVRRVEPEYFWQHYKGGKGANHAKT